MPIALLLDKAIIHRNRHSLKCKQRTHTTKLGRRWNKLFQKRSQSREQLITSSTRYYSSSSGGTLPSDSKLSKRENRKLFQEAKGWEFWFTTRGREAPRKLLTTLTFKVLGKHITLRWEALRLRLKSIEKSTDTEKGEKSESSLRNMYFNLAFPAPLIPSRRYVHWSVSKLTLTCN